MLVADHLSQGIDMKGGVGLSANGINIYLVLHMEDISLVDLEFNHEVLQKLFPQFIIKTTQ